MGQYIVYSSDELNQGIEQLENYDVILVDTAGFSHRNQEQREEMHRLQNMEPFEVVNVSYNSDTEFKKEEGYLTHLIGVLTTEKEIGAGLETLPMKAGTWAVFPNEGEFPSTLQNTMARIYAEWFMTADYELAESLSFSFAKMNPDRQGHAYSEIWIPVVKKER